MAQQQIRALLGWMERDEAIATQLGRRLPSPGQDVSRQLQRWDQARERVQARGEYNLRTPTIEPLPQELQERGQALLQRPDVVASFQGWDISVGMADLGQILSFQKIVAADALERITKVDIADTQVLFSFCLPDPAAPAGLQVMIDDDQRAFSIASANPNIRVLQGQVANVDGRTFFGFSIGFGNTFVQVVEYQGRWFIRDGYHRCYGLLRAGVDKIPCLLIRARDAQQFGGASQRFFRGETIFGPRPPFLRDFLNDEVAENATRPVTGRVIRIAADEFAVQL